MAKKRNESKDIRNFGIALAVLLAGFGGFAIYRERPVGPYLEGLAAAVLLLALFIRPVLRPVFRGWMWVAEKLNWITTRIILTVAWLVLFLPLGLALRLLRIDFFDRKFDAQAASYFIRRPDVPYDRNRSERLG